MSDPTKLSVEERLEKLEKEVEALHGRADHVTSEVTKLRDSIGPMKRVVRRQLNRLLRIIDAVKNSLLIEDKDEDGDD
jgi:archaellum component FlaC